MASLNDMPGLKSDSDTTGSDEDDFINANQSRPSGSPPVAPGRAPASAARHPSRPNASAASNPVSSTPQPAPSRPMLPPASQQRIPVASTTTRASVDPPPSAFRIGNCVRVIGLQQRSDLNGCPGFVSGDMEKASERWAVEVIKGLEVHFVKLRGANMTILSNLDAFDPGDLAAIPQELVSKDSAASDVHVRSQIRAQQRPWHRAALRLVGHKFYCSVRLQSQNFTVGFDMREIQKALEKDDRCVKAGLPLIFNHFGEIAFGAEKPEELFAMYFQVLPEALKQLPWNSHKFSMDPPVSDFRSVPLTCDTFCSSKLVMMRSDSHSHQLIPLIFDRAGFQIAAAPPSAQPRPCPEGVACLIGNIRREIQSKASTGNLFELLFRELFEQAFHSSLCAVEFAKVNLDSSFRIVHSELNNFSDTQALFFFMKANSLTCSDDASCDPAERQELDKEIIFAASHAQGLLVQKGEKMGKNKAKSKKMGRDFFGHREEVFKIAENLSSLSNRDQRLSYPAAIFARWAFRLGHADAKGLLHQMHENPRNSNCDATYFLARILQKSDDVNVKQCESMYRKVEKSPCQSAKKANQRLLMLMADLPTVAALRIYLWWFMKKRRQQTAHFRAKSLRDFKALLCEAELKSPYNFLHWKSPTEILDQSTFFGEALPCADGLMPDPDSDDLTNDADDPVPSRDVSCASSGASMAKPLVATPKVDRIDFHEFALNWIKTMRGNHIVEIFQHRLQAISEGERTYSKRKPLTGIALPGDSKVIYEAKLTKGDRILYTERQYNRNCSRSVIVWCVVQHKKVSAYAEKIRDAYRGFNERLAEQKSDSSWNSGSVEELLDETILMDPSSNALLRTFECQMCDLHRFVSSDWEPPVKLTTHEREIVDRGGSTLLQGRGGTGKTLCLISRLFKDYEAVMRRFALEPQLASPRDQSAKILFVSYSHQNQHQVMDKIRKHLRVDCAGSHDAATEDPEKIQLLNKIVQSNKMDRFMRDKHRQLRKLLAGDDWLQRFRFRADVDSRPNCVNFNKFQNEIWGCDDGILIKLRSKHDAKHVNQLSPIVVFSNIRTFIKGGLRHAGDQIEPEQGLLPLSREEYLEVHDNDCDVPVHLRELIYKAYIHYDDYMKRHKLWDEADLDADVYAMVAYICQRSRLERSEIHTRMLSNSHFSFEPSEHDSSLQPVQALSYDRIFVDECQDMSPVQIAILILLCNDLQNGLFFAGDTAQSVANGVYFRFEEVNSIVWDFYHHPDRRLCDKEVRFDKQKLRCNFRSHDGVLRVCDQIIKLITKAFPKGTTTVNSWMEHGLIKGPRPNWYCRPTLEPVIIMMMNDYNLKVLVWDEYVERAKQLLLQSVESIRKSHAHLNEKIDTFLERSPDGKIARFEIQVLGIRDVKGLEFDDVMILNFFSATVEASDESGPLWQSIPKSSAKSWKVLLENDDAATVRQGITDLQLQMQLKMLYTACSRCRCRLVFFEADADIAKHDASNVGSLFFRKLGDPKLGDLQFGLISEVKDSGDLAFNALEGRTRVLDDWACEAISLAHSMEDLHDRDRKRAVDQAIQVKLCLQKARPNLYCLELLQCDAYLAAVRWEDSISERSPDNDVIETACWYIEAGMYGPAANVISNHTWRPKPKKISIKSPDPGELEFKQKQLDYELKLKQLQLDYELELKQLQLCIRKLEQRIKDLSNAKAHPLYPRRHATKSITGLPESTNTAPISLPTYDLKSRARPQAAYHG